MVFFQQFYLAALQKRTVQKSFDIAVASVKSDPRVKLKNQESLFLLLPVGANHDVSIFRDLPDGKWENITKPVIKSLPARVLHMLGRATETQMVFSTLCLKDSRLVRF
jgi:hypothetical protein